MLKSKLNRYLLFAGVALSAFAPLAVVIACGETETKEEVPITPSTPTLTPSVLKPSANSTHAALTWEGSVSVVGDANNQYQVVQYLSGNFANEALAKAATTWSAELPKTVDFVPTQRYLWARALAAEGFNVDPLYLNLTETSGLQNVKSDVDALPAVTTLKTNLSQAIIIGDSLDKLALSVSVPTALPVKLQVQFNDDPWFDAELFTEQISKLSENYKTGEPLTIKARLVVDATQPLYVFKPDAPRVFNTDEVKRFLGVGASLSIKGLDASGSASHDKLTFTGSVEVVGASRSDYQPVEYATGVYPNQAAAQAGGPWSATLPTITPFNASDRYLWVRALPKAGAPTTSQAIYRDVTGNPDNPANPGSRIREVKANINGTQEYRGIDLTTIKLTGTDINAFNLTDAPALSSRVLSLLDLELQINGGTWFKASTLSTELQKLANTYVAGAVSVNARLALNASPTLYLFTPPTPQAIDTAALVTALGNAAALDTSTLTVDLTTSTQNSLVWNNTAIVRGAGKDKYALEYLVTELETIEAANAAEGWSTTLPPSVGFDGTKRHFYVRIRPLDSTNTSLTTYTVDVTVASQITKVKSNVNDLSEYITGAEALNTGKVVLVSYKAPSANPSGARTLVITGVPTFLTAPVVTEFSFDSANSTWVTYQDGTFVSAALAKFVAERADLGTTPTFKVRLGLRSEAKEWASLTNPPVVTLTLSDAFKQDLVDAASDVSVDLSTVLKANWSPLALTGWNQTPDANDNTKLKASPIFSDQSGKDLIASLPDALKEAVAGFEYLGTYGKIDTPQKALNIESSPDYDDPYKVYWKWTSDLSLIQWDRNSLPLGGELYVYTRVKLATTKKYKSAQDNVLDITRSSRIVFSGASYPSFRDGTEPISREDFDAAVSYIRKYVKIDVSQSTQTRVVFNSLSDSLAEVPAVLKDGIGYLYLYSSNGGNAKTVGYSEYGSFSFDEIVETNGKRLLYVAFMVISRSDKYIPEQFFDINDISNATPNGGAHIVIDLTDEVAKLPATN